MTMAVFCENGHELTADGGAVRFCRICGAPLLRKCPDGHLSGADKRYCRVCGKPMGTTIPGIEGSVQLAPRGPAPITPQTTTPLSQRPDDREPVAPVPGPAPITPQARTPLSQRPDDREPATPVPVAPITLPEPALSGPSEDP